MVFLLANAGLSASQKDVFGQVRAHNVNTRQCLHVYLFPIVRVELFLFFQSSYIPGTTVLGQVIASASKKYRNLR